MDLNLFKQYSCFLPYDRAYSSIKLTLWGWGRKRDEAYMAKHCKSCPFPYSSSCFGSSGSSARCLWILGDHKLWIQPSTVVGWLSAAPKGSCVWILGPQLGGAVWEGCWTFRGWALMEEMGYYRQPLRLIAWLYFLVSANSRPSCAAASFSCSCALPSMMDCLPLNCEPQ